MGRICREGGWSCRGGGGGVGGDGGDRCEEEVGSKERNKRREEEG